MEEVICGIDGEHGQFHQGHHGAVQHLGAGPIEEALCD